MRSLVALCIAMLWVFPAMAQEKLETAAIPASKRPVVLDKCHEIDAELADDPLVAESDARLYVKYENGWERLRPSVFFRPDYKIRYRGGAISFIYVIPASENRVKQFLSIRSMVDSDRTQYWVSLKRHQEPFGQVLVGQYQDYHLGDKFSGVLSAFHSWPNGERSDEPISSRRAHAFPTKPQSAKRRVLAIGFSAMPDRISCVNFYLGSQSLLVLSKQKSSDGDDEFIAPLPFLIEVTEAKNGSGSAGETFVIKSEAPETK